MSDFRFLLGLLRPHRGALLVGGVLGFVGVAGGTAEPVMAKIVIDTFGTGRPLFGP